MLASIPGNTKAGEERKEAKKWLQIARNGELFSAKYHCANPVRIVLYVKYIQQMIEGNDNADNMLKLAQKAIDENWKNVCKNLEPNVNHQHSITEIILPLEINNWCVYARTFRTADCTALLERLNPIVSGFLHIPDVRLRMAKLNLEIGKRYADNATVDGTMFSTKPHQEHYQDLPEPLLSLISPLLNSYQLLSPTTLSLPLSKQVCHQLGVILSTCSPDIAAHFILLASYMSFSLKGVYWAWKKAK